MNAQGAPPLEVVNGNVILYRRPNFFVRTVYHPGQKQPPLRKPSGYTVKTPAVILDQEQRIASGETRLMPRVTVHTIKQTRAIPLPAWLEAVIVILALRGIMLATRPDTDTIAITRTFAVNWDDTGGISTIMLLRLFHRAAVPDRLSTG